MATKYTVIMLTASTQSAGVNGSWVDVSRFRNWPICQAINNGSDSAISGTFIVQGALDTATGVQPIRLGSLAITAATTTETSQILLSGMLHAPVDGSTATVVMKYMRLRVTTLSAGNPAVLLAGLAEEIG